jgi:tetratricopeptide (TPR) repeat protein/outer membrane protein OmpA-like peptidoglycan-associated protein
MDRKIAQHSLPLIILGVLLSIVFAISPLNAQTYEKIADLYYENSRYCESVQYYDIHLSKFSDRDALMKRGRSHFYCGDLKKAIEDFENAALLGYSKTDLNYYLGKSHHLRGNYELAIGYYKTYLSQVYSNHRVRKLIGNEIKRCVSGINLQYKPIENDLENLGNEINSSVAEIKLIQSPGNENRYYFTRRQLSGNKQSRILQFTADEQGMDGPGYLNENHDYNNEMLLAISQDAQKLIFERQDYKSGKFSIYLNEFDPEALPLSRVSPFISPVNVQNGDRDLFMINDSSFLFSSSHYSGYGGHDIFLTGIRKGSWFVPVNLGPAVNTPFDEVSPCLSPDGKTVFFSSNRLESTGGYDVFRSDFNIEFFDWTIPVNLGIPLNSPGDELHYTLTDDGISGFLSSNRKTEGFGDFDLYRFYFRKPLFDPIAVFVSNAEDLVFLDTANLKKMSFPVKIREDKAQKTVKNETENEVIVTENLPAKIPAKGDLPPIDSTDFEGKILATSQKEMLTLQNKTESKIYIKPLYYSEGMDISENKLNMDILAAIAENMKKYPTSSLLLTAHSSKSSYPVIDLMATLSVTEGVESFLKKSGIAAERIRVLSVGSYLPLARSDVSERLKSASRRFNNRIDIQLFDLPEESGVIIEKPFVVNHIKENSWEIYQSIVQGLSYKILYSMTYDTPEKLNYLSMIQDCTIEKNPADNSYRVFSGLYTKYAQALEAKELLEEDTGIHLAIVPMLNGREISEARLSEAAKKYPDLENYIASLKR